MARDHAAEQWR